MELLVAFWTVSTDCGDNSVIVLVLHNSIFFVIGWNISRHFLGDQRVRSFEMIRIRISDPRSLGSWQIKWPDESTLDKDSTVHLIYHPDPDHFKGTHPKLVRLSKTNVLTIETDYYRSFWKVVRQTVFQSSFLLFLTFDMVLGRHTCWTLSCYFVIHELFFQVS